jgi:F0F1-type ATP synthase alpha subunit
MRTHRREIGRSITEKGELDEDLKRGLNEAIEEFKKIFK